MGIYLINLCVLYILYLTNIIHIAPKRNVMQIGYRYRLSSRLTPREVAAYIPRL